MADIRDYQEEVARADARMAWLEKHSTLHTRVEILYVVDGYEVQVVHEDGVTDLSPAYRGETLAQAIDNALSAAPSEDKK